MAAASAAFTTPRVGIGPSIVDSCVILPPFMRPASSLNMLPKYFSSSGPSIIILPVSLQCCATKPSTASANPSRHFEPQFLPINTASFCSADEVMVRPCFFVKTRNATGRRVAGGSSMGRMLGIGGSNADRIGCTGVPNAGDEDGTGFDFSVKRRIFSELYSLPARKKRRC